MKMSWKRWKGFSRRIILHSVTLHVDYETGNMEYLLIEVSNVLDVIMSFFF